MSLGQQEYDQRVAAVTWGIILAVLIPLVLLILFVAYKGYQRYQENQQADTYSDSISKPRMLQNYNRTSSIPDSDEEDYPPSPTSTSSTAKKRRSYDKSYRTHEPLPGLPQTGFEEKPWDPNNPSFYPDEDRPLQSPTQSMSPRVSSPSPSFGYSQPYNNSKRDIVKPSEQEYNSDDYAVPVKNKVKNRTSSQGSIVTDV